ncbi:hypothetical protein CHF27_000330 [Romboutsia maritimum]|uniref:Integrase catalytic domain-containing protein n=1 Tax=Romboutsia maritimum TaxID=2020948 RepID=A0A371IW30_9FIRM|nr:hypothetical protein CHF27_000330 [Romboutsia maritimum]
MYLSTILDLGDNIIVLHVISTSNNNKLVFDTFKELKLAINNYIKFYNEKNRKKIKQTGSIGLSKSDLNCLSLIISAIH